MTITSSHSPPRLDVRVGPHGYSHGWVKGDVLDGSWKLTGIQHDKGQCDHCGRDLGKVFQVVHPSGRTANLGSTHAAKATGFNKVQQAADAAAALEEKQKQRVESEKKLRAGGEGDLIDRLQARPQTVDVGGSTMASSAHVVLNQLLDGIISPEQAREEVNLRSRDEDLEERKAWGRDLKVHTSPAEQLAAKKASLAKKTAEFAKISDKDAGDAAKTWTESFRHTGSGTDKDFSDEMKRSQTGKGEAKSTPGAKKAQHFLQAVHERSTKQSGSLHRGMALTPAQLKKFGEGKHVDLPVSSWSKDQSQAQRFAFDKGAKKGVVLHTASGAKGWDISKHSASSVEKEVVTGGRFHVDRVVGNHVYLSQTAMHARSDRHLPDWFPSDFKVDDDLHQAFDESHPIVNTGAPNRVIKASTSPLQSRDWATWDLEHQAEGKKLSPHDYDQALQHHFQQGLKLAQTETHRGNMSEGTRRTLADMHAALAVSHAHHGKALLAAMHRGLASGYSAKPFPKADMTEKPMAEIKAGLIQKSLSKANAHNARRILAGNPHFAAVRSSPFEGIEFRDWTKWDLEHEGGHSIEDGVMKVRRVKEIGKELDSQGVSPRHPIRHVIDHPTYHVAISRDPTGKVTGALAYNPNGKRASTVNLEDFRAMEKKAGAGHRLMQHVAKQAHTQGKTITVTSAVPDAVPFYQKMGAQFTAQRTSNTSDKFVYGSYGRWEKPAVEALANGTPIDGTEPMAVAIKRAKIESAELRPDGTPWPTRGWNPYEIEVRDYSGGHHVPGTPFHFKHGWIPLDAFAEAQLAKKEIPSAHREAYKTAAKAGYSHAAHEHLDSVQIAAKAAPYYAKAKKAHATGDFQRAAEALGTAHGIMEASRDKKSHEKDLGITPHKKQAVGKGGAKKGSVSKPTPPPEPKPPVIVKPTTSTPGKTPADETKYMKGSPKYKAFNDGHAEALKKAQSEKMTPAEARTRAEFQRGQAREFPTAKGDTRKAEAEGRAAGYAEHAAGTTTVEPKPTPTPHPTPPKPSTSTAPAKPYVYDETKGGDENHALLVAHLRQALKDAGIKGSVRKEGNTTHAGRSIGILPPGAGGTKFTEAEQAKITAIAKENGLTGLHGRSLDYSINSYGGTVYLPFHTPPGREAKPTPPVVAKPTVSKPATPVGPLRPPDAADQAYQDAMASNKTAAQLEEEAKQAATESFQARRTLGYGNATTAAQDARQAGLLKAAGEKAMAEANSHQSLVPKSGWRKLAPDQTHQVVKDALVRSGVRSTIAASEATRLSTTHESHLMHDGSLVHFNNSTKVSPKKKQVALDTVAALRAKNPGKPPLEAFMGSGRSGYGGRTPRRFGKGVRGYAVKGNPQIWVAPATLKPAEEAGFKYAVDQGHFMPSGAGKDPIAYVLAHEYGHTIDEGGSPYSTRTNPAVEQALKPNGSPTWNQDISKYGKTNSSETYAEAHAEWFMSNGQTTNPTVRQIAAAAGWSA